jgi:hypothetical protein
LCSPRAPKIASRPDQYFCDEHDIGYGNFFRSITLSRTRRAIGNAGSRNADRAVHALDEAGRFGFPGYSARILDEFGGMWEGFRTARSRRRVLEALATHAWATGSESLARQYLDDVANKARSTGDRRIVRAVAGLQQQGRPPVKRV